MSKDGGAMTYRADIDGLRALAVWLVILFHFKSVSSFHGYMGVDIFFVISGYLITRIISAEIIQGSFSLAHFYERRARRLLPALSVVSLASFVAAYFLFLPEELLAFAKSLLATTAFSSNFLFWSEAGYFDMDSALKPLLHTWSLAVEEQFYIVFPLILMACYRWARGHVKGILVGLFVVSFAANIAFVFNDMHESAFYMLPMRMWELLVGALIALGFVPQMKHARAPDLCAWGGFILILLGVRLLPVEDLYFPGFYALLPVMGAGLIIYAGQNGALPFVNKVLSIAPAVFMGKISYSLYLWHWVFYVFGQYYFLGDMGKPLKVFFILACVGVSYLSWRFIEQPFRVKRALPTRRAVFAGATVCALFLMLCGGFLVQTQGARFKYDPQTLALLDVQVGGKYPAVHIPELDRRVSIFGASQDLADATIVVWGDSHAKAIAPALAEFAQTHGTSGLLMAGNDCMMPSAVGAGVFKDTGCMLRTDEVLDYFVQAPHIQTVIVAQRWAARLHKWFDGDDPEGRRAMISLREQSLQHIAEALKAAGKELVVLAQVPEIQHASPNIPSVLARAALYDLDLDLRVDVAGYLKHQRHMMPVYEGLVAKGDARVAWPHEALCESGHCVIQDEGGLMYYYDDDHLSRRGAERLAGFFAPYIR